MTDAETGWYLRHRDGVEHGPFRFADIIAAAKSGNIANDTCVQHEAKTLGQWVFAPRVALIADAMPKTSPRPSQARPSRATSQTAAIPRRAASSNLPPTSEGTATTADSEPAAKLEPAPIVRPWREQGYPVPKTFVAACIALVDFRFRSFVTPWIIKVLWGVSLIGSILWAGKLAYEQFVPGELPDADEVSTMDAKGEWQFEPLGDQPFLQSTFLQFLIAVSAIFVGLLCVRVLCEAAIVLLRAANDLHELKTQRKEQAGSQP